MAINFAPYNGVGGTQSKADTFKWLTSWKEKYLNYITEIETLVTEEMKAFYTNIEMSEWEDETKKKFVDILKSWEESYPVVTAECKTKFAETIESIFEEINEIDEKNANSIQ